MNATIILLALTAFLLSAPMASPEASFGEGGDSTGVGGDSVSTFPDSVQANVFRSEIARFEIRKPAAWHFADLQSVMEHRAAVKLKDEEMEHAMQALASAPLVAAAKHPEPYDQLNPTFQVLARPLGQLEGKSGVEILRMVKPSLEQMFHEFTTTTEVHEVLVGGRPAARMSASYTLITPDGTEFKTLTTMVMIPRGKVLYQIGFSGPPEGSDALTTEIDEVLATVKFLE